ncbi:MAG: AbrB/MazE/SpoVT family DNA-binding domain-containing protein [Clostridia bacterium]|nr:AbrB/MazE/SpoVT family DNA-binding domain-containing protein [Clostridia bacterium]
MNGIEKDIDSLGRVVIPIEYRRRIGAKQNSRVLLSLENDTVVISPTDRRCALCDKRIEKERRFRLCEDCILQIKAED